MMFDLTQVSDSGPHGPLVSKFYRRRIELVAKYNTRLRSLWQQELSKPEFYGDLLYDFRKIVGKNRIF